MPTEQTEEFRLTDMMQSEVKRMVADVNIANQVLVNFVDYCRREVGASKDHSLDLGAMKFVRQNGVPMPDAPARPNDGVESR